MSADYLAKLGGSQEESLVRLVAPSFGRGRLLIAKVLR